jgi:serine/threonine protein kinase
MADFELPGYEIYERIGKGGMATVYRALHLNLDREVAIKIMDPAMNADEQFSERFVREARISAQLIHPHILQIYDVNAFDVYNFITMELLSGGDLGDLIYGAMPQKTIYQIMEQMTKALDYAFSKGYVHRDIKPSNIMLRSPVEYVLADFGIARAARSETQMTQTGLMVGTPSYMSPEQAKGLDLDGRSDLYSLAVLFYEMMTKKVPYKADSPVTTAVMHLTQAIPTLPEDLSMYQAFIDKAMAKSADDRYQTGREMYAALMEASQGLDDDIALTPAAERIPSVSSSAKTVFETGAPPTIGSDQMRDSRSSMRSRPYKLQQTSQASQIVSGISASRAGETAEKKSGFKLPLILGLVAVIALGTGGYVYWQGQQSTTKLAVTSVTGQLASAYSAMNENKLTEAAAYFEMVLSADSTNAAALAGMTEVEGLFEQGITDALAKYDVKAGSALYSSFSDYFGANERLAEYGAALDQMEQEQRLAIAQEERIGILLERAQEHIASVDFDQAAATLEQAKALNPRHPGIVKTSGVLANARAQAVANEERWRSYTPEQRAAFETLLLTAKTAWEEKRYDEMASALNDAVAIAPEMPALIAEQEKLTAHQQGLTSLINEAEAAAEQSAADLAQAGVAIELFNQVLAVDSDNAIATDGIAQLTAQLVESANESLASHDYENAEAMLTQATEWLPEQEEFASLLADIPELRQAHAAQQQREAVAAAKIADVAELLLRAKAGLSGTKANVQKTAEVAGYFRNVLAIEPNNAEALSGIATLVDQAVSEANAAVRADKFSDAKNILAAANTSLPNQSEIRNLQRRLPGLEEAWRDRVDAEKQAQRERVKAEGQEQAIAQAERRNAISLLSSARVALGEGNVGGARLGYDQVMRSYPDLADLAILKRELQAAYLVAIRQQIESNELATAMSYVDQGMTLTPGLSEWAELKVEIELLQSGPARRRLGAY